MSRVSTPSVLLQSEASECGLACLGMIASAFGHRVDLPELRRRFGLSLKGAKLSQLIGYAEQLGLVSRPLRLELSDLPQLKTPCLLHWDLNHFVVLSKVEGQGSRARVTLLDPAVGQRRLSLREVSRHFTGVALECWPSASFAIADTRQRVRLSDLWGQVVGLRRSVGQVLLLALGLELFALLGPLFNQFVVDEAIVSGDRELLGILALGFGLLLAIQAALSLARSWVVMRLSVDLGLQWTGNVFAHLVRLPIAWFEKRHLGDIVSRFSSITAIKESLTGTLIEAVLDGLMALTALAMMMVYSVKLALVVLLAVAFYAALRMAFYRPFREASEERLILAARENSHFLETLRAIGTIRLFGHESARRARWQNLMVDVVNRDVMTQKLGIAFRIANTGLFGAENILVFYLGALMVMDNTLTVGMLFAFVAYKTTFTGRIAAWIDHAVQWKMLSLHTERLADIALTQPEEERPPADLEQLAPRLTLRNVSFRYGDGEPWILRNVDLTIAPGESVAIIGPSGCGKTTLTKILLGLLTPTEGEVLLDDMPIERLGLANYRKLVGTVMQEDSLLAGSIGENIAFFTDRPKQTRIEACTKVAAVHEDIVRMPMGYQTLVGDMGAALSGGQKQRILLARALYKQPRILALDEATSHLDVFNERRVNQGLKTLKLTRIIVAHRPETIAMADRMVILDAGKMREQDSHRARNSVPTSVA
jgi:ATP-binding cassette subfamily B protein RaxB